jgi:CTP synthase (UTP-ammonia lyase)
MKVDSIFKVALVGDQSSNVKAPVAIPKALALASVSIHATVQETWIGKASINRDIEQQAVAAA